MAPFASMVSYEAIDLSIQFVFIFDADIDSRLKFSVIPPPITCQEPIGVTRPFWQRSSTVITLTQINRSAFAERERLCAFVLGFGLGVTLDIRLHLAEQWRSIP